jgi:hypothetical protein
VFNKRSGAVNYKLIRKSALLDVEKVIVVNDDEKSGWILL